jgi:AraC-like DNA-binding protein
MKKELRALSRWAIHGLSPKAQKSPKMAGTEKEGAKSMSNKQSRDEYLRRIHKVQDYIEENLNNTLILSELTDIAGFSKYHFQTGYIMP